MIGACEASLACSTCHVYVHDDYFDGLPEPELEWVSILIYVSVFSTPLRLKNGIVAANEREMLKVTRPI